MATDKKALLEVKRNLKRKQPNFMRQEKGKIRLAHTKKYRAPRGIQSKQRLNRKGRQQLLKGGYQTPAALRDMDANGLALVRIVRVEELASLSAKTHSIIVGKVGAKRRIEIIEAAAKAGIALHNADEKVATRLKELRETAHKQREQRLAAKTLKQKKLEEKLAAEEKKSAKNAASDEPAPAAEAPSKVVKETQRIEKDAEKAEKKIEQVEKKVAKDKEHVEHTAKKVESDEKTTKSAAKTAHATEKKK